MTTQAAISGKFCIYGFIKLYLDTRSIKSQQLKEIKFLKPKQTFKNLWNIKVLFPKLREFKPWASFWIVICQFIIIQLGKLQIYFFLFLPSVKVCEVASWDLRRLNSTNSSSSFLRESSNLRLSSAWSFFNFSNLAWSFDKKIKFVMKLLNIKSVYFLIYLFLAVFQFSFLLFHTNDKHLANFIFLRLQLSDVIWSLGLECLLERN